MSPCQNWKYPVKWTFSLENRFSGTSLSRTHINTGKHSFVSKSFYITLSSPYQWLVPYHWLEIWYHWIYFDDFAPPSLIQTLTCRSLNLLPAQWLLSFNVSPTPPFLSTIVCVKCFPTAPRQTVPLFRHPSSEYCPLNLLRGRRNRGQGTIASTFRSSIPSLSMPSCP